MESLEIRQSSLRDFLHVIFKRKKQILVKIGKENLYIPPSSTNSQIINFNRDNQINSEIELLKSIPDHEDKSR